MPHLTRADVERVAALARLSLSEREADRMAAELETVLAYAESLDELDTRGVEPTAHAIPLPTPMREDRAVPPLDPELALANAPERDGTAFVVPRVLEGEEEG